ncbi:MAG: tRNA (adenosine(37)-N6)-threonylcarbamoyltransferase complex transferase subunit TsaD [Patescibacteria group bacterium]
MKILAIETSCDETAVSIIDAREKGGSVSFSVLGNTLLSQTKIHAHYGGVFPMVAKREHAKALTPLLIQTLKEAEMHHTNKRLTTHNQQLKEKLKKILERETDLYGTLIPLLSKIEKPKLDKIAVTSGPGLEPALWVGINFARALSEAWNIPVVPVNHMEGHVLSSLLEKKGERKFLILNFKFPMLALLVSGGHTELVLSKKWQNYKLIGATRDDAAGEAFDKVARMLGLPYPGGPEISRVALKGRLNDEIKLPRPMIGSKDFDFSFSGLKTAVLYMIKKLGKLSAQKKADIALEFENAAIEVLISKTIGAAKIHKAKTIVIGGGVSANEKLRREITLAVNKNLPKTSVLLPNKSLTTDNAIMIAAAAYFKKPLSKTKLPEMRALGNLSF